MSTKVIPKPKFKVQGVDFAKLQNGDWFVYDNMLCMKISGDNEDNSQLAVDTLDGIYMENMCGEYVRPVDVEIRWKRQQ